MTTALHFSGDKSLTHRILIFSLLKHSDINLSHFSNLSQCRDCLASLEAVKNKNLIINCQNSGTTLRLLTGLFYNNKNIRFKKSKQLEKRPMRRVLEPLELFFNGERTIKLKTKSAQVKSALLLAAINSEKQIRIVEPAPTRDHTEIILKNFGYDIRISHNEILYSPSNIRNKHTVDKLNFKLPGDISSASFFIVYAIIHSRNLILKDVLLNQKRLGLVKALESMQANIQVIKRRTFLGEICGDVLINNSKLRAKIFSGNIIVESIDELPLLALAATQAHGITVIKDAQELKVKETNRIATTVRELKKLGAKIQETSDGFKIMGPTKLKFNGNLDSHGDHRIAMMLAIAISKPNPQDYIKYFACFKDSCPEFLDNLNKLL